MLQQYILSTFLHFRGLIYSQIMLLNVVDQD